MTIQEHLDLIRAHAHSLEELIHPTAMPTNRRILEIRSMIYGILDRVMQIENEFGGRYGRDNKDGAKDGATG